MLSQELIDYNYCALAIAILKKATPEQAFMILEDKDTRLRKDITEEDVEDMVKLKKTMTYDEIAEIYGLSKSFVYKKIRRYIYAKDAC